MFGLNLRDPAQLAATNWGALRRRILDLLTRPPTFVHCDDGKQWWLEPVLTTRIQNEDDVRPFVVSTRQPTGDMEESAN